MYKIKLADLEATILDQEEQKKAIKIIRGEIEKRADAMSSITISTPKGIIDGRTLFLVAQTFENEISTHPIPLNFDLTNTFIKAIDKLSEVDPLFYEFSYTNGKNLLAAMENREMTVIKNRNELENSKELRLIKDCIIETYPAIEIYLHDAISKYEKFSESKEEFMQFYDSRMKGYLAMLYRRKSFFLNRSVPNKEDFKEDLPEIIDLSLRSIGLYNNIFEKGMFLEKNDAYTALINYANSMKSIQIPDNLERGLLYYKTARDELGPLPEIEEGIQFYNDMIEHHFPIAS